MSSQYVALGDSTAAGFGAARGQGYVERIHARLAGRPQLINLGSCGARSRCVADQQVRRVARAAPLVTVGVGANDVVHATPVPEVRATWRRIGDALARIEAPVVVGNVPDLSVAPIAA